LCVLTKKKKPRFVVFVRGPQKREHKEHQKHAPEKSFRAIINTPKQWGGGEEVNGTNEGRRRSTSTKASLVNI